MICWPHFSQILTYCTFKQQGNWPAGLIPAALDCVPPNVDSILTFSKTGCCVFSFVVVVFYLFMATPAVEHSCSLNTQLTLKMDGRFGALIPDFVWMRPLSNVDANGKCHLFGKPLFINHSMRPSAASMAKNHNQWKTKGKDIFYFVNPSPEHSQTPRIWF